VAVIDPADMIPNNAVITISGFGGGIIGILAISFIFNRGNLWVLYSNLQKSKFKYLSLNYIIYISGTILINLISRII